MLFRSGILHSSSPKCCLSSSNCKDGCCGIFSPFQVASSSGRFLHRRRYSLITIFLNCFSLVSKIDYCEIITTLEAPSSDHAPLSMSLDIYSQSPWLRDLDSPDPLKEVFPSNEAIMEAMSLEDLPWDDGHHHSSFLHGLGAMPTCLKHFSSQVPSPLLQQPVLTHDVFKNGNLCNIT